MPLTPIMSDPRLRTRARTPLGLLMAARRIIATPRRWTTGAVWRDARGGCDVSPWEACSVCAVGAVRIAAHMADLPKALYDDNKVCREALSIFGEQTGDPGPFDARITLYNDSQSRARGVVRMFDKAIAAARKAQASRRKRKQAKRRRG